MKLKCLVNCWIVLLGLSTLSGHNAPVANAAKKEEVYILRCVRTSRISPTNHCAQSRTGFSDALYESRFVFHTVTTDSSHWHGAECVRGADRGGTSLLRENGRSRRLDLLRGRRHCWTAFHRQREVHDCKKGFSRARPDCGDVFLGAWRIERSIRRGTLDQQHYLLQKLNWRDIGPTRLCPIFNCDRACMEESTVIALLA